MSPARPLLWQLVLGRSMDMTEPWGRDRPMLDSLMHEAYALESVSPGATRGHS